MSTIYVTSEQAVSRIRERQDFQVRNGNLSGTTIDSGRIFSTSYHLSPRERRILDAVKDADYAIYSYWTPIAWHDGRGWHVFDRSFTPTTNSRHLPIVRQALGAQWRYDYAASKLIKTRPSLYVAESENAYVTPYQAELLRALQQSETVCYAAEPTTEIRREIRSMRRLADKGYVRDASTPAIPDVFELTERGERAYV